ncbi:phage holin family protein [Cognatishimia sp. SS12]|uniref:phage holin family protein n=1 Tax=Cognatishimia sp. SS12 TaxID=2979465 RepID=UPI0023314F8D|nr:phage holin family protein [Cognatishimia sp. SS12]MDC0737851.1 phage holin family protein [Cognatishimia sp. SS12]
MAHPDLRQVPELFKDTLRHFSSLLRSEAALAKAELKENATRAGIGIAMFAVAGLLALVALNVLAAALVAWIAAAGISAGLSALIVGGILLAVAAVLVVIGKSRLDADALMPKRTIRNVQKDAHSIKEAADV